MKQIIGGFQNPDGTPIANGKMYLTLIQDATAIGGPQVTGGSIIAFQLDANGQLPANTKLWYNDELTPSGTAYTVSVVASGGGLVYGPEYFIFAGTSPSNVGLMFPSLYGGSVPAFSTAILANPLVPQTITGQPLTVSAGVNLISDMLLANAAANITFSSIPQTFKHLRIIFQGRSTTAAVFEDVGLQFNGDAGANYDFESFSGVNAAAAAVSAQAATSLKAGTIYGANVTRANTAGYFSTDIPNYASTTFEKTSVAVGGGADSTAANCLSVVRAGSWRNTAAISSIVIIPISGANFVAGTRATLYGL